MTSGKRPTFIILLLSIVSLAACDVNKKESESKSANQNSSVSTDSKMIARYSTENANTYVLISKTIPDSSDSKANKKFQNEFEGLANTSFYSNLRSGLLIKVEQQSNDKERLKESAKKYSDSYIKHTGTLVNFNDSLNEYKGKDWALRVDNSVYSFQEGVDTPFWGILYCNDTAIDTLQLFNKEDKVGMLEPLVVINDKSLFISRRSYDMNGTIYKTALYEQGTVANRFEYIEYEEDEENFIEIDSVTGVISYVIASEESVVSKTPYIKLEKNDL